MNRSTWLRASVFTLAVALVTGLVAALVAGKFSWGTPEIPKAQCEALVAAPVPPILKNALTLAYQERVTAAIVREPQNTWSNLAFVFVGSLIWAHDRRIFARLLGAALIALGLASGLYHASLLVALRTVDVATMGWVSFALCCQGYAAGLRRTEDETDRKRTAEWWIGLVGAVLAMTAAFLRNDVRIAGIKPFDTTYTTIAGIGGVFVLALVGVLRAVKARPSLRLPFARVGVLVAVVGAAVFCQINDRAGRCFCAPDGMVQAHAVWHVLMAGASALAYDLFALVEGRPGLVSSGRFQ